MTTKVEIICDSCATPALVTEPPGEIVISGFCSTNCESAYEVRRALKPPTLFERIASDHMIHPVIAAMKLTRR